VIPSLSYRQARERNDLPLPKTRRDKLCTNQFFAKNGNNSKDSEHLIKTSSDYDMRLKCKYIFRTSYVIRTDLGTRFYPQIISKENSKW
jgi:hypothetical protein